MKQVVTINALGLVALVTLVALIELSVLTNHARTGTTSTAAPVAHTGARRPGRQVAAAGPR